MTDNSNILQLPGATVANGGITYAVQGGNTDVQLSFSSAGQQMLQAADAAAQKELLGVDNVISTPPTPNGPYANALIAGGYTNSTIDTGDYYALCWSPELGIFLTATYDTHKVYTSPDGVTWTQVGGAPTMAWLYAFWSPDLHLFFLTGSGYIYSSPNGTTWTPQTSPFTSPSVPGPICWSSKLSLLCCIASEGNQAATSPDGI